MNVLISGASGTVGQIICQHLKCAAQKTKSSFAITALTQNAAAQKIPHTDNQIYWQPSTLSQSQLSSLSSSNSNELAIALQQSEVLIHLAGASIGGQLPWTAKYKREILNSRVLSSRLLVQTMLANRRNGKSNPRLVIAVSAAGYYGYSQNAQHAQHASKHKEENPAGDDFLAQVCVAWEKEWQTLSKAATADTADKLDVHNVDKFDVHKATPKQAKQASEAEQIKVKILRLSHILCPLDQFGFLQGLVGRAAKMRIAFSFDWPLRSRKPAQNKEATMKTMKTEKTMKTMKTEKTDTTNKKEKDAQPRKIYPQYTWIHQLDLARFAKHLIEDNCKQASGKNVSKPAAKSSPSATSTSCEICKFNVGTPYPITHRDLYRLYPYRKLPVVSIPARLVQALGGDMAALFLANQVLDVKKMQQTNFQYKYAKIEDAIENLLPQNRYD